jgi:hypothetical protein
MRNIQVIQVIELIAILTLIFSSCDKETECPNNNLFGPEVPIRVHMLGIAGTSSETLTRSSSQKGPQAVSIPIGNGLLMGMSMEETSSPLRATKQLLEDGKRFRVIAVTTDDPIKFVSYGDFEMIGGTSALTSPTFHVPGGVSYNFICISYNNSSTLPPIGYIRGQGLSSLAINNSNDFLWWKTASPLTVNSNTDTELDIELHHMLTKIKVIIDCTYNEWDITNIKDGITLASVHTSGNLNLMTGAITSSTGTSYVTWPQPLPSVDDEQLSKTLTIMPKSSSFYMNIPAGTVERDDLSPVPTTNGSALFEGEFNPGVEYTLRVKLWTPIFAKSNIYWDGNDSSGKLTFSVDANEDLEYLQGVFFKWGSLVGISPAQKTAPNPNNFSSAVPVYIPSGSGWVPSSYSNWGQIPFWDDSSYGKTIYGTEYDTFRGDICKYLGTKDGALAGYRLPTSHEFDSAGSWNNGADRWAMGVSPWPSSADLTVGNSYGTYNFKSNALLGHAVHSVIGVTLPASGKRGIMIGSYENLTLVGTHGCYWTSDPITSGFGTAAGTYFFSDQFTLSQTQTNYGIAVRCVKKLDPNGNY